MQLALMPLHKAMFIEANPITVKWASAKLGLSGSAIRLPMTQLSAHAHAEVEAALRECGLLQ
jgi:4-hydroxy-tetrahydrodipicolinate synthase